MRLLITLLFIHVVTLSISQELTSEQNITLAKAPYFISKSPIRLAKYLTENESSEKQKALNIYSWITHNIKYDTRALNKTTARIKTPKQTLRRRKGTCYQYSQLFTTLCRNAGISTVDIWGYSRGLSYFEGDTFSEADHSWNGIKLDSSWFLVDATWGAGSMVSKKRSIRELLFKLFKKPYLNEKYRFVQKPNDSYFLVSPDILIKDHLPADPNWQLLEYPISVQSFESIDWNSYKNELDSVYQKSIDSDEYTEILNKYEYLSDLQLLTLTAENSFAFNPKNHKLLAISAYNNASSMLNADGTNQENLQSKNDALNLYKVAKKNIELHRKVVTAETSKTKNQCELRISTELIFPSQKRIKHNAKATKEAHLFLSKEESHLARNESKLSKLTFAYEKTNLYKLDTTIRFVKERPEIVEKNEIKIDELFQKISSHRDSVLTEIASLRRLTIKKDSLQTILISMENALPSLIAYNIESIINNYALSHISYTMNLISQLGDKIDSTSMKIAQIEKEIIDVSRSINERHAFINSQSYYIQKLIIQNCQFSLNCHCYQELYSKCNQDLYMVLNQRISVQKILLTKAKNDSDYYRKSHSILVEQLKSLDTNAKLIAHYRARRLEGIQFKKAKSDNESISIINKCDLNIHQLSNQIAALKRN
jgi:hypothetical protein